MPIFLKWATALEATFAWTRRTSNGTPCKIWNFPIRPNRTQMLSGCFIQKTSCSFSDRTGGTETSLYCAGTENILPLITVRTLALLCDNNLRDFYSCFVALVSSLSQKNLHVNWFRGYYKERSSEFSYLTINQLINLDRKPFFPRLYMSDTGLQPTWWFERWAFIRASFTFKLKVGNKNTVGSMTRATRIRHLSVHPYKEQHTVAL